MQAVSALFARWNVLWFRPVDARSLGAMRIALGVLLIVFHVGLWPRLDLFSAQGPVDLRALREGWSAERWSYLDGLDDSQLVLAHVAALLVLLAFTLGAATPLTSWLSLVILVAIWHRSPYIQNGGDRLLRIWAFYMALTPCGRALSVDAWLFGQRDACALVPAYGLRLVQLQTMVMYAYTGIMKLTGSTWQRGTAIYYALSDGSFARFPELFDRVLATWPGQALTAVGTIATLAWEIGFVPLVLWRRTRWLALALGLMFHAGIFATMSVGIFSWASVWGYLAWIEPRRLGDLASRLSGRARDGGDVGDPVPVGDDPRRGSVALRAR
jgi:hypothetical protein